jgi:hypothetical protein
MLRCLSLLFIVFQFLSVQAQVSFITECNAKSVVVGSSFQLTFRLNNAQGINFTPPSFDGFDVINGPMRSMQSSFVNGVGTSSMGYVYTLQAVKVGNLKVGSASIVVNGKVLKSNPLTISVLKSSNKKSGKKGNTFFVLATLNHESSYVGQQLILSYKLYTQVGIDNIEIVSLPKLDKFSSENFNLINSPVSTEVYKGTQYQTKELVRKAIYPLVTGNLTIEEVRFRVLIGEDDDPFGFNYSPFGSNKIENISSNVLYLKVENLPTPIPSSFSGAVGQFNLELSKIKPNYSISDAIPVEFTLSGNGDFKYIKPELFASDSLFEKSDSRSSEPVLIADQSELVYSKKFSYLLTPKNTGKFLLPVNFSYFDPIKREFIHLNNEVNLSVENPKFKKSTSSFVKDLVPVFVNRSFMNNQNLFTNIWSYLILLIPMFTYLTVYLQSKSKSKASSMRDIKKTISIDSDITYKSLEVLKEKAISYFSEISKDANVYEIKEVLKLHKSDAKAIKLLEYFELHTKMSYSNLGQIEWNELLEKISEL